MKTQIALSVLGILVSSSVSFGAGFRCRATCVGVDAINQTLTFLGSVTQEADMRESLVLDGTEDLCGQRASRAGLDRNSGLLLINLEFSSSTTETYEHWSGSSHTSRSGVAVAGYASRSQVIVAGAAFAEFSSSYSSYSRSETRHSLWVKGDFATTEANCKFDETIPPGTRLVYTGTTPFHP